eukprot:scaffold580_cov293-Prasinococcus_capsulatus_cf.AAC.1
MREAGSAHPGRYMYSRWRSSPRHARPCHAILAPPLTPRVGSAAITALYPRPSRARLCLLPNRSGLLLPLPLLSLGWGARPETTRDDTTRAVTSSSSRMLPDAAAAEWVCAWRVPPP